tara:strand:- start:1202 stop:1609 length:408 start_codon:yes stop_codon:yes gene_type:complete
VLVLREYAELVRAARELLAISEGLDGYERLMQEIEAYMIQLFSVWTAINGVLSTESHQITLRPVRISFNPCHIIEFMPTAEMRNGLFNNESTLPVPERRLSHCIIAMVEVTTLFLGIASKPFSTSWGTGTRRLHR